MDRLVIVGGGIIGTSIAYQLRDADLDVVLVEQDTLGSGTTAASIAVFSWLQSPPVSRTQHEVRARSWETYGPMVEAGEISFERIGALYTAESEATLEAQRTAAERMRELGVEAEVLDPEGIAAHGVDPGGILGGLYSPEPGYLDPSEVIQHWAREARGAGVQIDTGTAVTGLLREGEAVAGVETTEGEREADAVVNAAGPWAPRLNEMAGVSMPLRHTFGPILVLQREEPFDLPFVVFDRGYYFREEGPNQAFAGKLEKGYDDAVEVDPGREHAVDESFRRYVAEHIDEMVPGLAGAELVGDWVGVRTVTPDGKPIVGSTGAEGYLAAVGMSGVGVTLAPAVGELVAERVETGSNEENPFAAARFGG